MKLLLAALISCVTIALVRAKSEGTITGTNIGGYFVLEPWITPSLFYRFLEKAPEDFGMDSFTFCKALGPELGNKVMRQHWDTFYTEQDIKDLANRGVQMVRLPIGDWTLNPYGPYIGCMDGSTEKIDWMMDTCAKYNITVLLDVHAMKDSQNGFDNSGETKALVWFDKNHFSHWPNAQANWLGYWNVALQYYENTNWDNVNASIAMCEELIKRWGNHPAFAAFEPVNEPWWNSDEEVLKSYYRSVRDILRNYNPTAKFVFHNAFDYSAASWNDMFDDNDMENVVMDHHYYQAWNQGMTNTGQSCDLYWSNAAYADSIKYDVWIGEWALATDVCATWLGGLNDGNTVPQFTCKWVDCPVTYMGDLGTDFNRTKSFVGPFGTGDPNYTAIQSGKCPTDSDYFSQAEVATIAGCALEAFDTFVQGTFFWTAHNEIEEKWDYVKAWDLGWLNPNADLHIKNKNNKDENNKDGNNKDGNGSRKPSAGIGAGVGAEVPHYCYRGWCSSELDKE